MLVIDSREREGSVLVGLVEDKCKSLNIPTKKQWLEIGDYVFDDVCFEAKSTIDFLGSVMSKRLWTQIDNMDRHYQTNILVLYGSLDKAIITIQKHSKSKLPSAARAAMFNNKFLGALARITLDTDCQIFWTPTEKEAALIITAICKIKPIKRTIIEPQIFKRITTDDLRLDLLTSIKGISKNKAKALIKQFGSLMEIGEQEPKALTCIGGIGIVVATRIINVLNSERKVKM